MPTGPCTVMGGLPLIADVSFTRDFYGDVDADVDQLYWMKRDGSKGAPVSEAFMEKLNKRHEWWEADVTEQVSEHLAYEQAEREGPADPFALT